MRVLLIWPKARTDPEWGGDLGAIAEPLALEYLGAGAIQDGHDVRILDLRLHIGDLDATLREYRPDVVGVTAFSMHVLAATGICTRVKELLPSAVTVAGGHHATFLPEDFFTEHIDYVVSGEGVVPFRALLGALERGQDIATVSIAGLWYRNGAGFEQKEPPLALDVEAIPPPDRSLTVNDRSAYFIDWMSPVASIRSTVGCPYRCTFCSLWQLTGGKYYARKSDPFIEELSSIDEEFVFLIDDEAFIQRKRMLELAQLIRAAGIRKRFFAYCRLDTIVRHRDALQAWADVGLDRLLVGIDGAFEQDLVEYNKGYDEVRVDEGLAVASELGIEIFAQFVVNTTYQHRDFERLARFIEHRKLRYPSFTVLTPLPGTPLLENFDSVTELQPNGRPNWDYWDTQNAVTATTLPPEVFRKAYRDLFRRFRSSYQLYRPRVAIDHSLMGSLA